MFKKLMLVVSAVALLGACADQWDVEGTKTLPLQGNAFTRVLHTEYVELAAAEKAEYDWTDTAYFLRRAEAAAKGENILPQAIEERDLTPEAANELRAARNALIAVLDAGARDTMPVKAARAQAAGFDCWMQEQEEGHQPDDIAACRKVFEDTMAELRKGSSIKPARQAQDAFVVHFITSSTHLDAQAMKVLQDVAAAWKARKSSTLMISGHTDATGKEHSNMELSQKRAERVANTLSHLGVNPSAMILEAYGEERPMIQTPDKASEARNRRVEIRIKASP